MSVQPIYDFDHNDYDRLDQLRVIMHELVNDHNWPELARVSKLVDRFEKLSIVQYQISSLLHDGPNPKRR